MNEDALQYSNNETEFISIRSINNNLILNRNERICTSIPNNESESINLAKLLENNLQ